LSRWALHGLGGALFLSSLLSSALDPLAEHVPLWLALYGLSTLALGMVLLSQGGLRGDVRGTQERALSLPISAGWILVWAVLIRLPLLPTSPSLSDDVFRYLWEGRVLAAGFDPYEEAPESPLLAPLAKEAPEWELVNHPHMPAIYPPGAQWLFSGLARIGANLTLFKLFFLFCDLGLCALLIALLRARGQPACLSILYAWHPLAAVETCSSGHFDALALLPLLAGLLLWQRRRVGLAFITWGMGWALKVVGGIAGVFALGLLLRQGRYGQAGRGAALWILIPGILAAPFLLDGNPSFGSARAYGTHWMNFGSVHALLSSVLGVHPARWLGLVCGGFWTMWLLWRGSSPLSGFFLFFLGLLLLSPVVHPWYGLWLLIFVPFYPRWDLFALVSLLPLSYLAWPSQAAGGDWMPPLWAPWFAYGVPLLLFLYSLFRANR
jgi:hypothetical protein